MKRTLSVRAPDDPSKLAPPPLRADQWPPEQHLLILVHGFNVPRECAERCYARFLENLERARGSLRDTPAVVEFHWPGDYWPSWLPRYDSELSGGLGLRLLRQIFGIVYPQMVAQTEGAASRLAEFLLDPVLKGRRGEPIEVSFIAHSMGCRLVLETLARLEEAARAGRAGRVVVKDICLMAAAVPVQFVSPRGPLARLFLGGSGALTATRLMSLHSKRDGVLKWLFPEGEEAARLLAAVGRLNIRRGLSFWSWPHEAMGLNGRPNALDGLLSYIHEELEREDGRSAGHGDYWENRTAIPLIRSHVGVLAPIGHLVHEIPQYKGPEDWDIPTLELPAFSSS